MSLEELARDEGIKASAAAGSGTAIGNYLGFLNEYGVAIGVLLTLFFGAVGWYYKNKEDKRREREHQVWLQANQKTD